MLKPSQVIQKVIDLLTLAQKAMAKKQQAMPTPSSDSLTKKGTSSYGAQPFNVMLPPNMPAGTQATPKQQLAPRQANAVGNPTMPRPTWAKALITVLGNQTLTLDQIMQGLAAKGWLPTVPNPRKHVVKRLSQNRSVIVRVGPCKYCASQQTGTTQVVHAKTAPKVVTPNQRPPLKQALVAAMGTGTMTVQEALDAMVAKGWPLQTANPKNYVSMTLSSNRDMFEATERGKYRVKHPNT